MNGKMMGSKPLYVALAQRKEDRKAQLASQYMARLAQMRMQSAGAMQGEWQLSEMLFYIGSMQGAT